MNSLPTLDVAAAAAADLDSTPSHRHDAAAPGALNAPYGGTLKDLYADATQARVLRTLSAGLPGWDLTERQLCDLELLLNGAFSPLTGFLGQADYDGVVERMRLADGTLWSLPITLDVSEAFAAKVQVGERIALKDAEGTPLAILEVSDLYRPDRANEALKVFGTTDTTHPGVADLLNRSNPVYLGGKLTGIEAPTHFDFVARRHTPAQLRAQFAQDGWTRIVAFQTRNPLHRAHRELTWRAAAQVDAKLLIQPVVGRTKPGDVDHFTRVRCYQALLKHYPEGSTTLSLLPLAMRMGGPREALLHAMIRKNYGASHFIIGRDHAGPGNDKSGKPFYEPFAAQELLNQHAAEIGIGVVAFPAVVYVANRDTYAPTTELQPGDEVRDVSGTELRRILNAGETIPAWYTFPEVADILHERHPKASEQGFVVFFTGLSGSGKSTISKALIASLAETSARPITLLDGDEVRKHLSKGLGFSKEDRSANIQRIAWVAAEIARHGGIAVCAPIAPYAADRFAARKLVEAAGGHFIEVHVSTALDVCEGRDRKGLYAKARAGELKQFTGIDDPYEVPEKPELRLDTEQTPALELAQRIRAELAVRGLV